jgi:hypothetical protein
VEGTAHSITTWREQFLAIIHSLSTNTNPVTPYGEVSAGSMQISAPISACIIYKGSPLRFVDVDFGDVSFTFQPNFDTKRRHDNTYRMWLLLLSYEISGVDHEPEDMSCRVIALMVTIDDDSNFNRVGIATSLGVKRQPEEGKE